MTISESKSDAIQVRTLLDDAILQPESIAELDDDALDLLLRVGRRARLLGRFGFALANKGKLDRLPIVAADQFQAAMTMAESRRRLTMWELNRITWSLRELIPEPYIVLKGCSYELLGLPNARGRIFADVDLMMREAELDGVECRLKSRGWTTKELTHYDDKYYRKWSHELPPMTHEHREIEIDLHHNILPRTARLCPPANKIIESANKIPNSKYWVLCEEDIVLHAIVHLFADSDLSDKLRDLVDISDLLAHFDLQRGPTFWKRLVDRSRELGLQRPTYYALHYSQSLLGSEISNEIDKNIDAWGPAKPIRRLMDLMVPFALYPVHPDRPSRSVALCRLLLFIRSHWVRMPPLLLAYHLTVKFVKSRITRPRAMRDDADG